MDWCFIHSFYVDAQVADSFLSGTSVDELDFLDDSSLAGRLKAHGRQQLIVCGRLLLVRHLVPTTHEIFVDACPRLHIHRGDVRIIFVLAAAFRLAHDEHSFEAGRRLQLDCHGVVFGMEDDALFSASI